MSTQKYERIYEYIHEYQRLVYDFYSKDVVAFLTTYYSIDTSSTVWDDENLMGGSYDRVGELSGIMYNKILLLPVYYSEEMTTTYDAQDIGYVKDGDTQFVIPSSYGIVPLPGDKIKLEQDYLRPENNIYPIYSVKGVEKTSNTDRVFYRLKLSVEQSVTETQLDEQVAALFTFFEYDKKIHTIEDAQFMAQLLVKNEKLKECIKDNLYDNRSGYYFNHGVGPC
jgi:hypothetical protein